MAIASIGGRARIPEFGSHVATIPAFTTTAHVIDAASEAVGMVLTAKKTGNISNIIWGTRTVTTGATIDVRVETVSLSTGFPTGTLFTTNSNGSQVVANTDDNTTFSTALTAAAAVTKGDHIGVVIQNPAASFGNMQIAGQGANNGVDVYADSYPCFLTGGSWAMVTQPPLILGLQYDDGSFEYYEGLYPISSFTSVAFSSSSNPNHRGLRFQVGTPVRVIGFWAAIDLDSSADVLLVDNDWDGTDGDALGKIFVDTDLRVSAGVRPFRQEFPTPITLSANTTYRLIVRPTTTTNLSIYYMSVGAAARWDQTEAGQQWYYTTANNPNDATDWTDTTTDRPLMGIVIDGVDDGAGGAGGGLLTNPGMGGGMRN